MTKYISCVLGVLLTLLAAGCAAGDGGEEPVVNLYGWSEYVPQALLDGFSEETGIQVNYDTYSSNEEILATLQGGGVDYDLIIPSDYMISLMANRTMLESLDQSKIPNMKNLSENMRDLEFDPLNKYSVPYQWGTTCLVVDTSKMNRPITKWADLWDPEFKGKVVLPDDQREVIGMALRTLRYDNNSTDEIQLEEARLKLAELEENIAMFDSDSPSTALLAGEAWLGQVWNGEAALAHQQNPAIEYVIPEEGCTIWIDNLAIPKDAPHKVNAHKLINYILDPEASLLITAEFPYSNPNQAALELLRSTDPGAYEAYMSFAATNPAAADMVRLKFNQSIGEATGHWDSIWQDVRGE